jgi:hypothetical protein
MSIIQVLLNTLAGIIASFLVFWGSIIPGLQLHTVNAPPTVTGQSTFPTASTTPAKAKPQGGVQKSGLPASGGLAETGNPRTFATPPAAQQTPTKPQEQINIETRAALVNILCMPQTGLQSGISGSGVIVDSRGIILTNAHVAQFFLLRDYITPGNVNCVVRTGSPAETQYTATLLYLPAAWIAANASQLKAAQAMGTGEDDFAFLLITGRTDPAATLPQSFAHLPMDRAYVDTGDPMLLAAYPAGFLGNEGVQKSLYASSAIAYVTQLFSFSDTKRVDLFSVGGTVVSQGGSSGGAAVRLRDGTLAGIITTETTAATTGERDLRALALAHIDDELAAQGRGGITALLTGDLSAKATAFNTQIAPGETAQLEEVLNNN